MLIVCFFLHIKSSPNLLFGVLCLPGDQSHPFAQPTINPLRVASAGLVYWVTRFFLLGTKARILGLTKHWKAGLAQSLWGLWVLVHARFCLSPLSISADMGFDSKRGFTPPTVLLGFLLCPWTWGIFSWWDPIFSCWWLLSIKLQFWSSHRRRWAHILLFYHLGINQKNYIKLYK